ncbi:MAG: hypothetical protein E7047_00470 [Lentisphaerae bacterium]|nr:hypothetical protein [Lentisphaerota bacterium]
MTIYAYSFANKKRDLSDVLSSVVKDEPRFISNFKTVQDGTAQKHEWLEDQIEGRNVTVTGVSGNQMSAAAEDISKLKVGTLLVVKNDPALFRVTAVNSGSFALELAGANGSDTLMPDNGAIMNIVSSPMAEGSVNGDGEETSHASGVNYNYMQIFRKDIVLTGTALAINVYGSVDNQLNRQTAFALGELARDLNRVALFGVRREPTSGVRGEAGGLYCFAAGEDCMSIDGANLALDSFMINDAAQNILSEGGEPMQILCSPGQARVLSNEYKPSLQILRSDNRRGAYVATIVNEISGRGMTIMADPDVPDNDIWVMDTTGLGLASLKGRSITDVDATPQGFDGVKRMALGELTFEFKNARQRLCRIHNVLNSAEAIKQLKNAN